MGDVKKLTKVSSVNCLNHGVNDESFNYLGDQIDELHYKHIFKKERKHRYGEKSNE